MACTSSIEVNCKAIGSIPAKFKAIWFTLFKYFLVALLLGNMLMITYCGLSVIAKVTATTAHNCLVQSTLVLMIIVAEVVHCFGMCAILMKHFKAIILFLVALILFGVPTLIGFMYVEFHYILYAGLLLLTIEVILITGYARRTVAADTCIKAKRTPKIWTRLERSSDWTFA